MSGRRRLLHEALAEHGTTVPNAQDVDLEQPAKVGLLDIDDLGVGREHSGVVDQHIDPPERSPSCIRQRLDRAAVRHITADG